MSFLSSVPVCRPRQHGASTQAIAGQHLPPLLLHLSHPLSATRQGAGIDPRFHTGVLQVPHVLQQGQLDAHDNEHAHLTH